ncbi:hypothetical protein BCR33DRAFT_717302 [Rhizoclosmatium globosum]|uniref:Uncharacterized protein n=1 Tax=Rhizoclosmatium globosum TaxID=329046 RepID=A0A1Y2CBA8_9FUNG|nr:hypothetical protein BCR33DRAFT_717302 [Rhizoclosmatium globosum]|eukprot:ORY43615.1 hypothetical protein BCR33DRAFT_717302 [Rhizoclosmatium globosum]
MHTNALSALAFALYFLLSPVAATSRSFSALLSVLPACGQQCFNQLLGPFPAIVFSSLCNSLMRIFHYWAMRCSKCKDSSDLTKMDAAIQIVPQFCGTSVGVARQANASIEGGGGKESVAESTAPTKDEHHNLRSMRDAASSSSLSAVSLTRLLGSLCIVLVTL